MLSEETAVGEHAALAVEAMAALTRAGEGHVTANAPRLLDADIVSFASAAAGAAVSAAERLRARAIVTLAGSGLTALAVSKFRPRIPIVAMSAWPQTRNRLNVLRGVTPLEVQYPTDVEQQLVAADHFLVDSGWAKPGDPVVVASAMPLGTRKETNTLRFHRVRDVE
jgi:pyruvate kinase